MIFVTIFAVHQSGLPVRMGICQVLILEQSWPMLFHELRDQISPVLAAKRVIGDRCCAVWIVWETDCS